MNSIENFLTQKQKLTQAELKKYKTQGYLNTNSLNKRLANLKEFIYWLEQEEIIEKAKVRNWKKSTKKYIPESIVFTRAEVKQLKELIDLSPRLERVRDIMLLMVSTGLRFSDVTRITKSDIKLGVLKMDAKKTDVEFSVPLTNLAKTILEKYKYTMPEISNQKFNVYIKELLVDNGLCMEEITVKKKIGKKWSKEQFIKWEKISSHTGRRTMVSESCLQGIPVNVIQGWIGHQSLDMILHYLSKISPDEKQLIKKLDF